MRATPRAVWVTPSPRRRQSRRIFQLFISGVDVLDAGADLAVGGVVLLLPRWQLDLPGAAAVRNQQPGAG